MREWKRREEEQINAMKKCLYKGEIELKYLMHISRRREEIKEDH